MTTYDGFYLYRCKQRGSEFDSTDLEKAISQREMHPEFGETLKEIGIYVKEHFPS